MLSVRPDVLSMEAIKELRALQDSVKPFPTEIAMKTIEHELQLNSIDEMFSEISPEPVASASLAQVYKGRLNSTQQYVAIKVQRPQIVELVSKDLYVLQKATHLYQKIIRKLFPAREMDYIGLFNEWAIGFYTELDFLNEAHNQIAMKSQLAALQNDRMYIPEVYLPYCTRRLVVTEWIDGVKLSTCPPTVISKVVVDAQDVFLTQLFTMGLFHAGNKYFILLIFELVHVKFIIFLSRLSLHRSSSRQYVIHVPTTRECALSPDRLRISHNSSPNHSEGHDARLDSFD